MYDSNNDMNLWERIADAAELSLLERNSAVFLWSQYSAMDALQIKITDWREDK